MVILCAWLAIQSAELDRLIEALRSESVEERDRADRELSEYGLGARRRLEELTRDRDPEVAARAKVILLRVEVRRRLSPRLRQAFPDAEPMLRQGRPEDWPKVFLRVTKGEADRPSPLDPSDVEGLVLPALRNAEPPLLGILIFRAALWDLDVAIPEIGPRVDHPDAETRGQAIAALGMLKAGSWGRAVAGKLADPDEQVRRTAFAVVAQFGPARLIDSILPHLGNDLPSVREEALKLLARGGVCSCSPAVARLLRDPSLAVRLQALRTLESIGGAAAAEIEPLLADPDSSVRLQALRTLGRLGDAAAVPVVRKFLDQPEITVRQEAIAALVHLGVKEAIPDLLPLLAVNDLRQSVIYALGRLEAREALPLLVGCLSDPELYVRQQAVLALGRVGDSGAVSSVAPLLKDPDPRLRVLVAETLARLGSPDGVPILLAEADRSASARLFVLNALRAPDRWSGLRSERKVLPRARTPGDIDRSMGPAQWSAALRASISAATTLPPLPEEGAETSALEALERSFGRFACEVVLEEDRVRLLTPEEGRAFWKQWQAGRR